MASMAGIGVRPPNLESPLHDLVPPRATGQLEPTLPRGSNGHAGWYGVKPPSEAISLIVNLVGTSVASQESVPAAFAVVEVAGGDPWQAAVISANLGGDTDTIGAIAAGMAGACAGMSRLPQEHVARLRGIDLNEVRALAADLVAARLAAGQREGYRSMTRLVHAGSAVIDYVYRIEALPLAGTRADRDKLRSSSRRRLQHDGRRSSHRHARGVRRPAWHRPQWRCLACRVRRGGHRDADPAISCDGHRQLRGPGHRRCRAHIRVVAGCRRDAERGCVCVRSSYSPAIGSSPLATR